MLPVGMEGVYIEPTVGTVPGVGLAVEALPVRNSVCIKLSDTGRSNLGNTGADWTPAGLGVPAKHDSGGEDDTPCMVFIPGMDGRGCVPRIGICGCGALIGLIVVGSL